MSADTQNNRHEKCKAILGPTGHTLRVWPAGKIILWIHVCPFLAHGKDRQLDVFVSSVQVLSLRTDIGSNIHTRQLCWVGPRHETKLIQGS